MKESYNEELRKKTYYDKLGKRFKPEITEVKEFNLTKSKERSPNTSNSGFTKTTPRDLKSSKSRTSNSRRSKNSPNKSVNSSFHKPSLNRPSSTKETKPDNKPKPKAPELKYEKLRIHYAKDKYDEVNVYENTNPQELATE